MSVPTEEMRDNQSDYLCQLADAMIEADESDLDEFITLGFLLILAIGLFGLLLYGVLSIFS